MIRGEDIVKEAAEFKGDARRRFESALEALLTLAWAFQEYGKDFTFEVDADLYNEALRICREMSDGLMDDAKKRIYALIESLDYADEDAAYERYADAARESMDMAGTHLLALAQVWLAEAFVRNFTKSYTKISIIRYLSNPLASGLFGAWGKDIWKWGQGYDKNLIRRLGVIGQNLILDSVRYAEWVDAQAQGYDYYIVHRGSNFDCPVCDEGCEVEIPITIPFSKFHPNCMCWPQYFHIGE